MCTYICISVYVYDSHIYIYTLYINIYNNFYIVKLTKLIFSIKYDIHYKNEKFRLSILSRCHYKVDTRETGEIIS